MIKHLLLGAFCFLLTSQAIGQITELDRSRLNTAAYYNYTEQGDVTMQVHVWGSVRYPGLYEIPRNSTLTELISLSGGPLFGERASRSTRNLDLRLHRYEGVERQIIFQTRMKNEIVVRDEDPILLDGDVITMEAVFRQGFRWRDLFPIVSMVGTIVLILDRVSTTK